MEIMMKRSLALACTLLMTCASIAQAHSTLIVGDHVLLPNTAHQAIQIFIQSDATGVTGADVTAIIGDGGPAAGGSIVGPTFSGVSNFGGPAQFPPTIANSAGGDMISGTPFASNTSGQLDFGSVTGSGVLLIDTSTNSGSVSYSGTTLFVTLYVDTTGITSGGPWDLTFGAGSGFTVGEQAIGNFGPDSDLGAIPFDEIINGHIGGLDVPEPSTLLLTMVSLAVIGAALLAREFRISALPAA
jgi:hypothetical protein